MEVVDLTTWQVNFAGTDYLVTIYNNIIHDITINGFEKFDICSDEKYYNFVENVNRDLMVKDNN